MTMTAAADLFIELDPVIGWQASTERLSPVTPAGLAVDCVTGQPLPFAPSLTDQPGYPIALAHHHGSLFLVDDAENRVRTIDLGTPREFATVTGYGGFGRQPRQLRHPRGMAVLEDGACVIADTGNHQVKIFSCFPHALLSVWGSGAAGNGPREFNTPWKVAADRCGLIYITDRVNGRVLRIRRDGRADLPIGGLKNPTGLALGPDGTLVVLDGSTVHVYAPGGVTESQSIVVEGASCVTVDDSGYLYIGTSGALIYKYEATGTAAFRQVGIGVTGVAGRLLDLLWTPEAQLVGILLAKCAANPTLVTLPTCGSYLPCGILTTNTLDSGIENCIWDRIHLNATIPSGTIIEIVTQTANSDVWTDNPFQAECTAYSPNSQNCALVITQNATDCLVQSTPGRYLRMQLQLKTNGVASPVLRGLQISFPRASYLQYLPAVYQEDDRSRVFLDRFLRIFQTTFDEFDRTLDDLWRRFDPQATPDSWFSWLAAWIALPVNPLWTDTERRAALKSAGQLYPRRGTPAGVQQLVAQYSGVNVRLIEHFRLRQLIILSDGQAAEQALGPGTRLWSRDYYRRLQLGVYSRIGYFDLTGEPEPDIEPLAWGASEFTVFFDCDPYQVASTQKKVLQAVEQEKPAYTKANYAPVFPRMRVGVQSTLGVDTRIGECTPLLLGATGTLDYDTILACSKTESHLQAQHATLRPLVDVNARLL
jgi:phage tail-like protein